MISQVECGSHDAPAIDGDAPTPAARNLGDQTMSPEAAENAADFGAFLLGIFPALSQMGRGRQPRANIPIIETADAVIPVHDALE